MSGKYQLKANIEFSAAHALRDYPGDCARIHGHNWKIEAEIEASALDALGIGVDFKEIKKALNEIVAPYDHQYINEIPPFDKLNPTAENIAAWIYQTLAPQINTERVKMKAITLWETNRASVRYTEND